VSVPYAGTVLSRSRPGPVLLVALGAACISSSAVLVQLSGAGAATTAVFRCALALPVLGLLARMERRRHGPRPPRARILAGTAGVFLAVDLVLWTHAIHDVGAGVATVLGNLQVVFVALAAWLVQGERPSRRLAVALPVVMLGVFLVSGVLGHPGHGSHPVAGVVYGAATSAAYAGFLLVYRRASSGVAQVAGPLADATLGATAAAVLLGLAFGSLQWTPPLRAVGWLALLALTSQVLGWLLITSSLPRLPAAVSAFLLLLQPVATLGLAAVVLAERPGPLQLAGAALVCAGVLVVARSAPAEPPVPAGEPFGGAEPAGLPRLVAVEEVAR
jgi:drug/metabolite transporter (DMT)-like permease